MPTSQTDVYIGWSECKNREVLPDSPLGYSLPCNCSILRMLLVLRQIGSFVLLRSEVNRGVERLQHYVKA